jgi:uncharacterized protein (TIGR00299 family) protein
MQIHLDPMGGWSGDMFVAALLDAFPSMWPEVEAAVAALGLGLGEGATCRLVAHQDVTLAGRRFVVAAEGGHRGHEHEHRHDPGRQGHDCLHDHYDHRDHPHHHTWADIREHLQGSQLDPAVKQHAIGIFALLAAAEAEVHGRPSDAVEFHEVGAVDSIVDIVAAAQLIVLVGASRWTSSPLPLGSGRIRTAHGLLPLPAPATVLLLRGLPTIDDGISGERVTPTGAAVARHLLGGSTAAAPQPRRLVATGIGFGSRAMPGISNCLRALAFDETDADPSRRAQGSFMYRDLGVITFEVDDQSPEDLTHGLHHVRGMPGIHDVIQSVAIGKKGRMATHVQVLVAPEQLDAAVAACFEETTTIGLRDHLVHGAVLNRYQKQVEVGSHRLRVKTVRRPDGETTAKTEAADVANHRGHARRAALRRAGEAAALDKACPAPPVGEKD